MNDSFFKRIALLGLGLIGSSLARALREKELVEHISAFDTSRSALTWALAEGFIDSMHPAPVKAVENADIIVFAAPPSVFANIAAEIKPAIKSGAIITDVASVKRAAIAAIKPHMPTHAHYVPAHPIAGSEKTGVRAGRADLFATKCVILTPEEHNVASSPVAQIHRLWERLGARIEYMPADLHDQIYAYVSHLPQLVAFALKSGRLAQSSPELWADICLANADYIREALDEFLTFGAQIAGELSENAETSQENAATADALFPKLIAVCLIAAATVLQEKTGVHPKRYAGSGFAEMTAPAEGDPEAVLQGISEHPRAIAKMLTPLLARLSAMKNAITQKDYEKLLETLR